MSGVKNIRQMVDNHLRFMIPLLYEGIKKAYAVAYKMGMEGEINIYSPPLERERLADEQGRAVLDVIFKFAQGNPLLDSIWELNSRKHPHAAIIAGELHITAHRVPKRSMFPRHANYRQQNALTNRCWLTGLEPAYDRTKGIYMYILHGPAENSLSDLGFVQLGVPAPEKKEWLCIWDINKPACSEVLPENIPTQPLAALKIKKKKVNED